MVEIINSLEDLCRLCAGKIDVLMGLNIFASDHRQIFKKICVCLPIQVSVDDSFPKMVCVDCACKLDLMFDFRERSILTAHLFSDMMTVNSGNILNVDQSITITNEGEAVPEHVFSEEYIPQCSEIPCKIENGKFNNSFDSTLTDSTNSQKDMDSNVNDNIYTKTKLKPYEKNLSKKQESIYETGVAGDAQHEESGKFSHDKGTTPDTMNIYSTSDNAEISTDITNKDMLSGNKEKGDTLMMSGENAENVNECCGLEWFYCNVCSKTFANKEKYDEHNLEKHCHTCKCGESCESEEALRLHVAQDHPQHRKKIKQKKSGKIKVHDKKAESKVCKECGKQYQTNYKLQEHMKKHTGEKPFLCSYQDCKKAFRSKIGLAQHEANHSGQFEYSCSTCGKGFQCKSYLVVHQRVHSDLKPFLCKQCSRRFKTKQSLLDHMNRHLGVKPFLCDICGRGFITKGLCKSHQKVHSGTDNRQYPCHVCRKLFVSKSYLNTHFRIHTGEKPFTCEVCGKGFLTRVDLRIHSTMHTGEKSFVCEMCGKAFARRDALRCHRRSHTGERPYKCEFCGQSFTQFSPMAIHKRLHTGERPYECDVCSKTFVSRSAMLAHRKKHHSTNNGGTYPKTQPSPESKRKDTSRNLVVSDGRFQFVAVEVQQEELNENDQQPTEQLVMIEDSPQLLLALSKRPSIVTEPSTDILPSLHKLKNENSIVPVE